MFQGSLKNLFVCVLVLLAAAVGAPVYGQGAGTTGSLTGTVVDVTGGIIPGADVVAKNNATGSVTQAVTDTTGNFLIPALAPGQYSVTVSLMGFKTVLLPDVTVTVGVASSIRRAVLEVGQLQETVVVTGSTEIVQAQSAAVTSTLTTAQITKSPLATRNTLDFVAALPGVNTTSTIRNSTVMGLQASATNITIDGLNVQDNYLKSSDGFFARINPRMDAVEEVTVSTATPGAESAGQGAVQIRFATRSGTNRFQGSGYGYYRRPNWNSNYWFNERDGLPKDKVAVNTQGFRVGGPIQRDKLFYFFNYEQFSLPGQTTARSRTVLTDDSAAGIFKYNGGPANGVDLIALAAKYNQLTSYDPVVQKLLADVKATFNQGTLLSTGTPHTQTFNFSNPSEQVRRYPTLRMDYNVTSKHRVGMSYYLQQYRSFPDTLNNMDARYPGFGGEGGQDSDRWSVVGNWRWTISPNMVSEVRGGATGGAVGFASRLGKDAYAPYNGFYLTTPIMTSPLSRTNANERDAPTYFLEDTVSWIRGKHALSIGGTFTQINLDYVNHYLAPNIGLGVDSNDPAEVAGMFAAGNFPGASATDRTNARSLYALLTGRVTSITGTGYLDGSTGKYVYLGDSQELAHQRELGLYVQDSWRVRPDLTATFGVRYQMQLPFVPGNGYYSRPTSYANAFGISGVTGAGDPNLFAPCGGTGYPACTGSITQFVNYQAGDQSYETDRNNVAPSLGVAWRPSIRNGGWLAKVLSEDPVFRAGYSVAYTREGMAAISNLYSFNPGGNVNATRNMSLGNLVSSTSQLPLLYRNTSLLGPPSFPEAPNYPITGTTNDSVNEFSPQTKTPYVQSFTVSFQRALTKNTAVDVRYVGTRGSGGWVIGGRNMNEYNLESGFLEEFRKAQANLTANLAAGKGATFAYTGVSGTVPLPITLAYLAGLPAAQANDPTKYTSTQFASTTWVNYLAARNPNPGSLASALQTGSSGSTLYRNNATKAGQPANLFLLNPDLGGVWVTGRPEDAIGREYNSIQIELRRRMSAGLLIQGSYQYVISANASNAYTLKQPFEWARSGASPYHTLKVNWLYELPFGQGKKWGGNVGRGLNMLVGGWSWDGSLRTQTGNVLDFGNVRLNGFTDEDLKGFYKLRFAPDAAGKTRVYMLPQDVIDNTIKAYSVSATSPTGYGSLGAPTGRYFSPINGPECIQAYTGSCTGGKPLHHYVTGPAFFRADMSISKRIDITRRIWSDLRVEVLNVFDNTNFFGSTMASPYTSTSNYEVTSAYRDSSNTQDPGGRLVQLSWRVSW